MVGAHLEQRLELGRVLDRAELGDVGGAVGGLLVADRIHDADVEDRRGEELGGARHGAADEDAAGAARPRCRAVFGDA